MIQTATSISSGKKGGTFGSPNYSNSVGTSVGTSSFTAATNITGTGDTIIASTSVTLNSAGSIIISCFLYMVSGGSWSDNGAIYLEVDGGQQVTIQTFSASFPTNGAFANIANVSNLAAGAHTIRIRFNISAFSGSSQTIQWMASVNGSPIAGL